MTGERVILHCDCNNFYASVELLERPDLRDKPVAVAGDPEHRHGIILAKNQIAKRFGYSESKVKMILKRTRDKLRVCLEKEGICL